MEKCMEFIENPNLPERKAGYVFISCDAPADILKSLENMDIKPILVKRAKNITTPVCSHADILIHHLGGKYFVCEPTIYDYIKESLNNTGAVLTRGLKAVCDTYPGDCLYNSARIGNFLFANLKITDKTILDYADDIYAKKININQGYAKCNICVVNKNAIITSDEKICKTAVKNGFDVLKIQSGGIEIKKYNYGFIGGATGLLSKDIMAFCGNLKFHPDALQIRQFLRNYNIYPENLSNTNLTDVGSIIAFAYK